MESEATRVRQAYARRGTDNRCSRFNPAYLVMMHEREKWFLKLLRDHGYASLQRQKILEIGCGAGDLLRDFVKWGARPENVTGIDLIEDRVIEARYLCPTGMRLKPGNAACLEFNDEEFDLVFQSTVFTSVLDVAIRRQMAREMCRVLKPSGAILWFDYHVSNPRNPDVRGVKRREIYDVFPGCHIELGRVMLAPPITYVIAAYSPLLCYLLQKVPFLCTHYIGVIRKKT
jgi:ubiquinone/menaquinone biosynthesis C-methylase UbiE